MGALSVVSSFIIVGYSGIDVVDYTFVLLFLGFFVVH